MRSGAVVRCTACQNKYRIKSAHFEREVHTGPKTLDETDTVLRSDSVDIDPDEVGPVSIDDDGNVVGLSGLSELMRFSDDQSNVQANVDAKRSKDKAKAEQDQAAAPLPVAKTAKKNKTKKSKNNKRNKKQDKPEEISGGKRRAQALKRKKQNKLYIMLGSSAAVIFILAIVIVLTLPDDTPTTQPIAADPPETDTPDTGDAPTPPDTVTDPDPGSQDTDTSDGIRIFTDAFEPSPNPDIAFQPPWIKPDTGLPPVDVPTVLTPAKPMSHEGWYVMNPPRGAADAPGDSNVELGQITAATQSDGNTLLAGDVANYNAQVVMSGELHIMLLDSTGNVFAETYTPLAMIKAKGKQPIALTIPTRYWKRSRGVRAGVQVTDWADTLTPMQDVQLDPVGQGESTALRISVKHLGDKPLRHVRILVSATDAADKTIASFLLEEQGLYIAENQWLDLVIATPLPADKTATNWSAIVVPQ